MGCCGLRLVSGVLDGLSVVGFGLACCGWVLNWWFGLILLWPSDCLFCCSCFAICVGCCVLFDLLIVLSTGIRSGMSFGV